MVTELNLLNPLKLQDLGEDADMDDENLDEEELDEESDEDLEEEKEEDYLE
jgi:hypothetical protein